jgi:hypothetical protein
MVLYNDLEQDPDLFTGKGIDSGGDLQFDIYRWMRDAVQRDWNKTCFKTNIYWLHYLLHKLQEKYAAATMLTDWAEKVLEYSSVQELVEKEILLEKGFLHSFVKCLE